MFWTVKQFKRRIATSAIALLTCSAANAQDAWSVRGDLKFQAQGFTSDPIHTADQKTNLSFAASAEFSRELGDNTTLTISPFARIDEKDEERTHADLRELLLSYAGDDWELRTGLGKVFWGVAESRNPVDIINQQDAIEGNNPEFKLGQPMINLQLYRDWADVSLFILPGFRPRSFAGIDGRPRIAAPIRTSDARYESGAKQQHIDVAARVSRAVNEWDIGLHAFHGTARDPLLQFNTADNSLSPFYYQTTQFGIDAQATLESWLLKAEAIHKSGKMIDNHAELVAGVEYSIYGISDTSTDLGIVAEWLFDDRGEKAGQPFQNDVLIGFRFALNDEDSTEALLGTIIDLDGGAQVITLEASRRFADTFRLSAEAAVWRDTAGDAAMSQFDKEDYLLLEVGYFF